MKLGERKNLEEWKIKRGYGGVVGGERQCGQSAVGWTG